eukprot:13429973-Alexandrium_andersonii.AAC.1
MLAAIEHEWVVLKSSRPFQRERCFISTLPAGGQTRPLPRRREAVVFDRGWRRRSTTRPCSFPPTSMPPSTSSTTTRLSLIHISEPTRLALI